MKRMMCGSCDARLDGRSHFCSRCGEPTPEATVDERRQHDLDKWRAYHDADHAASTTARTTTVKERTPKPLTATRTDSHPPRARRRIPRVRVSMRIPRIHTPARMQRSPGAASTMPTQPPQDPFAHRSCTRCERADWLVRTGKDEVGAWKYWCVRCSRSFTTEVHLRHSIKPFAVTVAILLALTLLTTIH
jgi:hypothetical protein